MAQSNPSLGGLTLGRRETAENCRRGRARSPRALGTEPCRAANTLDKSRVDPKVADSSAGHLFHERSLSQAIPAAPAADRLDHSQLSRAGAARRRENGSNRAANHRGVRTWGGMSHAGDSATDASRLSVAPL